MKFLIVIALISASNVFSAGSSLDIIYGEDNRVDIEYVANAKVRKLAKSVAAQINTSSLSIKEDYFGFKFAPLLSDRFGAMVCEDENFANQPTLSDCTAFLVGEDLLATAGHCVADTLGEEEKIVTGACEGSSWVFDYKLENGKVRLEDLPKENLYSCKEVVFVVMEEARDFALIRLDRKVTGREPLKIRTLGKVEDGQELFVIGNPTGLPQKYADGARVFGNTDSQFFSANLDTFGGNSGSPVFNASTGVVEGILVRGRTDFVDSKKDGQFCRRSNICDENLGNCLLDDPALDGEQAQRTSFLAEKLLNAIL